MQNALLLTILISGFSACHSAIAEYELNKTREAARQQPLADVVTGLLTEGHHVPHKNLYACPEATCQNDGILRVNNDSTACECDNFHEGACCEKKRCIMGGELIKKADGTVECKCPPGHTGAHCERVTCGKGNLTYVNATHFCNCPISSQGKYCEQRRCLNGGKLRPDGTCRCAKYFLGRSCEYIMCEGAGEPQPGFLDDDYDGYQHFCHCYALFAGRFCQGYNVGVICVLIFIIALVLLLLIASALSYAKKRKTGHYRVGKGQGTNVLKANPALHENDQLLVREPSLRGGKGEANLAKPKPSPRSSPNITSNPIHDQ